MDPRRAVPRTDDVLADPRLSSAVERLGRRAVKQLAGTVLERCRRGELAPDQVVPAVVDALPAYPVTLRPVVNATGVVVHTNLGRAPLSAAAVEALTIASGATDVELDLATGRRGRRGEAAMRALAEAVPEAGGVHVVNNGAAALALVTCALASGREVVVARGELVEIGDGFRIPELIESVGATIREVGTTNRVRLSDYQAAVDERTAFVLKVHPSNFRVEGFTSSVGIAELATLDVPVVADLGSGLLAPHPRLPDEPDAASALRAGADLVTASGDKLLGGPQCGLLLGRADLVERLRRFPFARAVRVDKLTLAALEATLTGPPTPVATALATDPDELLRRATAIAAALDDALAILLATDGGVRPAIGDGGVRPAIGDGPVRAVEAVRSSAAVGGGGAPGVVLESAAVSVPPGWAAPLRALDPAVVGHVEHGRLLLDLIAVPPTQDEVIVEAVRRVAKGG